MSNLSQRLLEERKRLGLNQTDFGASGADILYIFTGNHAISSALAPDEAEVLNTYRLIASDEQRAALRVLMLTMVINKK